MNHKLTLCTQIRMPEQIVPINRETGYSSIAEMFNDDQCQINNKIRLFTQIARFETLNGVRKDDLHAILKWLDDTYDFSDEMFSPRLV